MPVFIVYSVLAVFALIVAFFLFCGAAGLLLYLSYLTTTHASVDPVRLLPKNGAQSAMSSHTEDPRLMDGLRQARDRWLGEAEVAEREKLSCTSRDGLLLYGEWWPARSAVKTAGAAGTAAVVVHGYSDSGSGMAWLAEEYHRHGVSVLVIDQRAHGLSEGSKITMGVKEAEDLGLWVDRLCEDGRCKRIIVHGVSMGAATVLLYASGARAAKAPLAAVIADSSYSSYGETFKMMVVRVIKFSLLAEGITAAASLFSLLFSGVSFSAAEPLSVAGRITAPLLVFHGQADRMVPARMARALFSAAGSEKKLYCAVPLAPHIGAWAYAPDLYWQKIQEIAF